MPEPVEGTANGTDGREKGCHNVTAFLLYTFAIIFWRYNPYPLLEGISFIVRFSDFTAAKVPTKAIEKRSCKTCRGKIEN